MRARSSRGWGSSSRGRTKPARSSLSRAATRSGSERHLSSPAKAGDPVHCGDRVGTGCSAFAEHDSAEAGATPMGISVNKQAVYEAAQKLRNWGRWGRDDQIGTINHVKPEGIVAAAGR